MPPNISTKFGLHFIPFESFFFQSQWFARQGGANAKEFVSRCLDSLMSPELQLKVNRPGSYGKEKFPEKLEDKLKGIIQRSQCTNAVFSCANFKGNRHSKQISLSKTGLIFFTIADGTIIIIIYIATY